MTCHPLQYNGENRLGNNYYKKVWETARRLQWSNQTLQQFLKANYHRPSRIVGEHFVISQTLLDRGLDKYNEWETMVFLADENGKVKNWMEQWCHRENEPTPIEELVTKAVEEGFYEWT